VRFKVAVEGRVAPAPCAAASRAGRARQQRHAHASGALGSGQGFPATMTQLAQRQAPRAGLRRYPAQQWLPQEMGLACARIQTATAGRQSNSVSREQPARATALHGLERQEEATGSGARMLSEQTIRGGDETPFRFRGFLRWVLWLRASSAQ